MYVNICIAIELHIYFQLKVSLTRIRLLIFHAKVTTLWRKSRQFFSSQEKCQTSHVIKQLLRKRWKKKFQLMLACSKPHMTQVKWPNQIPACPYLKLFGYIILGFLPSDGRSSLHAGCGPFLIIKYKSNACVVTLMHLLCVFVVPYEPNLFNTLSFCCVYAYSNTTVTKLFISRAAEKSHDKIWSSHYIEFIYVLEYILN